MEEFRLFFENKFSVLCNESFVLDPLKYHFYHAVIQADQAIGDQQPEFEHQLLPKTQGLIAKRRIMVLRRGRDQIGMAELSTLINKSMTADIREFIVATVQATFNQGGSFKVTSRKLNICKKKMHEIRDASGKITNNVFDVLKITEKLPTKFLSSTSASDAIFS